MWSIGNVAPAVQHPPDIRLTTGRHVEDQVGKGADAARGGARQVEFMTVAGQPRLHAHGDVAKRLFQTVDAAQCGLTPSARQVLVDRVVDVPSGCGPAEPATLVSFPRVMANAVPQRLEIRAARRGRGLRLTALQQQAPDMLAIAITADEFADIRAAAPVSATLDLIVDIRT